MYFIVKVKFVEGNQNQPRQKIVSQAYTLEEALQNLENAATDYIMKKLKPGFSQDSVEVKAVTKVDTTYVMVRSKYDSNLIEIHEKVCTTETKSGFVFSNETVTRTSKQIGYFCYIKYGEFTQTCDKCLTTINRPLPSKVTQGNNPELLRQIGSNALFKKCQESVAQNAIDLDAEYDMIAEINDRVLDYVPYPLSNGSRYTTSPYSSVEDISIYL